MSDQDRFVAEDGSVWLVPVTFKPHMSSPTYRSAGEKIEDPVCWCGRTVEDDCWKCEGDVERGHGR